MYSREPVYPLTAAVERVKDTLPDQDAEDWLKDAIAAGRIRWAYELQEIQDDYDQNHNWPSLIDIPPLAATMEVPDFEIDWTKGMATVRRGFGQGINREFRTVECRVVVSRRDLDRKLANSTTLPKATDELDDSDDGPYASRSRTAREVRIEPLENAPSAMPDSQHGPQKAKPSIAPQRPGRKKGSGSLASKDAPLLEEMGKRIAGGAAPWAAAMVVANNAAGAGTLESKAKRLTKRYSKWEANSQARS